MNQNEFEKTIDKIIKDPVLRKQIVQEKHQWFFNIYFPEYIKYKTAQFQKEMFGITENQSIESAVIVAFRGSAKSTIFSFSYPIWAMISKQRKRFILIVTQTQAQAKSQLGNIKRELESNELLRADLGPFQQENEEWAADSIMIPSYNARIAACSTEQSIRGARFGSYRPDLIIVDDAEDLNSTKTKEGRSKTFNWFTGEVIPCGDKNTKLIVIGNLLHRDSLTMRLKKMIIEKHFKGIFKEYPLVDNDGKILWPGKFPSMKEIDDLRNKAGSESAFQREMMLKIITTEEQIIKEEYLHYYKEDEMPSKEHLYFYGVGVDLAISDKSTADYTAMVVGAFYKDCSARRSFKLYILPNSINEKITFPQTIEYIKRIYDGFGRSSTNIFVETFAYQSAVVQQLDHDGVTVKPVRIPGTDKRTRLNLISNFVRTGQVVFPEKGAEDLIQQLLGFGSEKHDDLVDAFVYLVNEVFDPENRPITMDDISFI